MTATKKQIRQSVIAGRKELSARQVACFSSAICRTLETEFLDRMICQKNLNILAYDAINNEVDLSEFINAAKAKGASVFKPFILKEQKGIMKFAAVDEEIDPLGKYASDAFASIEPEDANLVVCPLVAFNENCNRLGYGGGFYDRYLEKLPVSATVVGVAYELQKVSELPLDEHDKPLSVIITETQIYSH